MKLYTTDNSELMEVTSIVAEGGNLLITGTIMGAVPVKAVVKPEDLRAALRTMSPATMVKAAAMPVRGTPLPWLAGAAALFALLRARRK